MSQLSGKTLFISGGSRGIGLAIAVRAARDGANVALMAKTGAPHPKLLGTVFTAAAEIEAAGGQALPIVGDIRDGDAVSDAVERTVERFGGIDLCVNNASALDLSSPDDLPLKRLHVMKDINVRGTYMVSRECVAHLKRAHNPHILRLSPPVDVSPRWLSPQVGYTMANAYAVVTRPSRECGNAFLCEDVLMEEGVVNFDRYAYMPGVAPAIDLYVEHV
jgi:citronellol/citronellal dehydrogenase